MYYPTQCEFTQFPLVKQYLYPCNLSCKLPCWLLGVDTLIVVVYLLFETDCVKQPAWKLVQQNFKVQFTNYTSASRQESAFASKENWFL